MLLLAKLKGDRSNFHYSGPKKAQLVDPEFIIQVIRGVQNIQTCVRTPCKASFVKASLNSIESSKGKGGAVVSDFNCGLNT